MGKAKRIRARRQRAQQARPGDGVRVVDPHDLDALGELTMADMPGRATYLTDPVLGRGQPVSGVGADGSLIIDDSGTVEPLPVVLFEPAHAVFMQTAGTGLMRDALTEAIIAAGFHRVPPGPVWVIEPAPGWEVCRQPGELVLRDGTGQIWASSKMTLDPAWVSAASSYRHVIVLVGPQLGVRVPPGTDPAGYTTVKRAEEIRTARGRGLVTAAAVSWRGDVTGETLEWVTFPPGAFGVPIPALFAPVADFDVHGGPEMYGLASLPEYGGGLAVPADPVQTLTARVSRTGIDLLDPAEEVGFVGGVRFTEGLPPVWHRAALSQGYLLLLTGASIPIAPGPGPPRRLEGLWGAIIPVRAAQPWTP